MFTSDQPSAIRQKTLSAVIIVLLLFIAGSLLAYLIAMDQYLRDTAKSIGELQARVQSVEEQEKRDSADIDDLYNQIDDLNGTGPGAADGSVVPQGSHT